WPYSPTDEPPNDARLPKPLSPLTVPGASSATAVMLLATGSCAICSAVNTVVDSTEETSIGLIAALPTTVIVPRLTASPPTKLTWEPVPSWTSTSRVTPSEVTV